MQNRKNEVESQKMTNKSKIAFYRKILIATLIDADISSVPLLVDATAMGRRTVQEVINSLSDINITCLRSGSTKSGYYYISDWGLLSKKEIKKHLRHIIDVLECLVNEQLIIDVLEGIPMSEQRLMQAMFNQQRLQIMNLAVHNGEYTNAYLYAWTEGVYPIDSDTDGSVIPMPHECYEEFFKVTKEQCEKVLNFVDQQWLNKKLYTFDELENEFGGKWDEEFGRMSLVNIMRYAYLSDLFDEELWNQLLTPMGRPSEASYVTRKFERKDDVDFI